MKKVTFKATYKIGKETRTSEIVEYTQASDAEIRLRALALNWILVSVEAA